MNTIFIYVALYLTGPTITMSSNWEMDLDILQVHSKWDEQSAIYKDVINFFIKNKLSVSSVHEPRESSWGKCLLYAKNQPCFTICLLTRNFLDDELCATCCLRACTNAVENDEKTVFYVKSRNFSDEDIPAGLKGISGVNYDSPFFEHALRQTFKKYLELKRFGKNNRKQ